MGRASTWSLTSKGAFQTLSGRYTATVGSTITCDCSQLHYGHQTEITLSLESVKGEFWFTSRRRLALFAASIWGRAARNAVTSLIPSVCRVKTDTGSRAAT